MKHALYVPNYGEWGCPNKLLELARSADESGFDGFFLWDHVNPVNVVAIDTISVLSAVATVTKNIKIGPMITPIARRRPWKLARELSTLNSLSGGRLIFGTGLGDPANEEFGVFGEETNSKKRALKLDDGLKIMSSLVNGRSVSTSGPFYTLSDVKFKQKSDSFAKFPIWIASTLPAIAGLKRSVSWNGVFPVVCPDEETTSELEWSDWFPTASCIKKIYDYVGSFPRDSEEFDIVASGKLGDGACRGESIDEYKIAGATWWFYWVPNETGCFSEVLRLVNKGPIVKNSYKI